MPKLLTNGVIFLYKNYNINQLVLPLDLEIKLEKNDIAFAIHHLVESIPEEAFHAFRKTQGATAYHPRMMLKIILCGYTQATFSGRKIEALTKDSIRMMWLAGNYQPSYRTINRFRVNPQVQGLLRQCFVHFRNQLVQEKEMDTDAIFIDGTKIEANANKYTFVWRKSTEKHLQSLHEKSEACYQELLEKEIIPSLEKELDEPLSVEQLQEVCDELKVVIAEETEKIETATSTEIRKELRSKRKLPKQAYKQFQSFLERKRKYQHYLTSLGNRNSFSKTDYDATFMRMKEDHMRNGQLKAGYNLQIATNKQYILGYDVFPNPTDTRTLLPFLNTLKQSFLELPPYIVADAGYGSEENYETIIDTHERVPLITYATYVKEQKKSYKQNPFIPQNWVYDEKMDTYLCPNNRKVPFRNDSTQTDRYGFTRYLKYYECEDCSSCSLRANCTRAKKESNRVLQKNRTWEYFKAYVDKRLKDTETMKIYAQRKIDVEPAFRYLKASLRFTRLSVRGKEKVKNELGFALMAVNLRKYTAKGSQDQYLFYFQPKTRSKNLFVRFSLLVFLFFKTYIPASFLF